ncbi:MAG: gamma-glutamyl-gamma-aminobutyrate hydrolase family protein [Pseudomonadota bacterium]|nr:gamma-glutamyl-gamma-aminobutyrate hydrolase family protein [Pseudomonadota bacterium]
MKNPTIGFASCFFHADPQRPIFKGKTLLYIEEQMAQWVMNQKALPFLLPQPTKIFPAKELVKKIDGLLLQAGSDVSPHSYGEDPLNPEWSGDKIRDHYELTLLKECLKQDKPVLGICRGLQIINVFFKGSLFQDINSQVPNTLVHRKWEIYDQNFHEVDILDNTHLSRLFPRKKRVKVNSIHHQGIKDLGKNLVVEARSHADNIIEAIRYLPYGSSIKKNPYVFAVQWHPEFHNQKDKTLLNATPILKEFLHEVRRRK